MRARFTAISIYVIFYLVVLGAISYAQDYEFEFDVEKYEKKPFEYGGHFEILGEHFNLNRQSTVYKLNYFDGTQRSVINRITGTLELDALYRWDGTKFRLLTQTDLSADINETDADFAILEGYFTHQPNSRFSLEIGKKTLKWGKGYGFSPVGFVERTKDPNDPEVSREGYYLLTANFTRSYESEPKTVSFEMVAIPVYDDVNEKYGETNRLNLAARLYLLYHETDIDFLFLGEGSRSGRVGIDFSRNLQSNLEIHGEWAILFNQPKPILDDSFDLDIRSIDRHVYLLGFRYLTASNITNVVEYYHNGAGFSHDEMADFYDYVEDRLDAADAGDTSAINQAKSMVKEGFLAPNSMRNYLYVRSSWKEPNDILYFTPAITAIYNIDDGSYSLTPEFFYSGLPDSDIRLRFTYLSGGRGEEFGEKQNDFKVELKYRMYF